MNQLWQFPQDGREFVVKHDSGWTATSQLGVKQPENRPGVFVEVPDSVPDGNGCLFTMTCPGRDPFESRGILWKHSDGLAGIEFDDIRLNDSFKPAARTYTGNMCGIRVAGLPPIPGGASNPDLFLSWFFDRYNKGDQIEAINDYIEKRNTDILLSWPDSKSIGVSADQFRIMIRSLQSIGLNCTVMLTSKYFDPWHNVPAIKQNISEILPYLVKTAPKICLGWELSLWLNPYECQDLVNWLAPQVTPWGGKLYVHFQQGYSHYAYPGEEPGFAIYWTRNVGLLTGILHQRDLSWSKDEYQGRIKDCLDRFAGATGCATDSGFGHPFDFIALEITAQPQYDGSMSEAEGNSWGRTALQTPPSYGPLGIVPVMGSGNGQ